MKTLITFTITGSKQGVFKGDDDNIFNSPANHAIRMDYEIISPVDVASGLATGKRQHSPVTLTHPIGASSVQLFNAVATNEILPDITINFTGIENDGSQFAFYRIKLMNARISRLYQYTEDMEFLEDISFIFQSIEETHLPSNSIAFDDWTKFSR